MISNTIKRYQYSWSNIFVWILIFCLQLNIANAQNQYFESPTNIYQRALSAYQQQQYTIALQLFEQCIDKTTTASILDDCKYYVASCTLKNNQPKADDNMLDYVSTFNVSPNTYKAHQELGDYYFEHNEFEKSLYWLQKIEEQKEYNQTEKFNYQIGYCYFVNKKYIHAKKYFYQILKTQKYRYTVAYYLGYIAYDSNSFEEANSYFDDILDEHTDYQLTYFRAYINFKSGNYKLSIIQGKDRLKETKNPNEISQLNKIIGESYFNLRQYQQAIQYLSEYKGDWKNTDYYQLGYAYYKNEEFKNAISQFNKIIGEKDATAQSAYYHLGECYFEIGDKLKSLNAFIEASSMNFNPLIRKDAWLNRARLSYDLGNVYQSSIVVLDSFNKIYPDSPHKIEIEKLIANALIDSKDYDRALKVLEHNQFYKNKNIYQKIAFEKGLELFHQQKYDEAILYFEKSRKETDDKQTNLKARYWIAEASYQKGGYEMALYEFKHIQLLYNDSPAPEIQFLNYHIGYTYFQLKQYKKAINHFNEYVSVQDDTNSPYAINATLRIADCYHELEQPQEALKYYQKIMELNPPHKDYPQYQIVVQYGILDQYKLQYEMLEEFINYYKQSKFLDDAYLLLAKNLEKRQQIKEAIQTLEKFQSIMPYSSLFAYSLMEQARLYTLMNNNNMAISNYKKVVSDFPKTQESIEAIGLAKNIYIQNDNLKSYTNWIKKIDFDDSLDYLKEKQTFRAARKSYSSKNITLGLERYLREYPSGIYINEVYYLMAQNAQRNNKESEAMVYYQNILDKKQNRFTELSLINTAQYLYEQQKYKLATELLKQLSSITKNNEYLYFSNLYLAHIAFKKNQYDKALSLSQKIIDAKNNTYLQDAYLLNIKIYATQKKYDQIKQLLSVINTENNEALVVNKIYYDSLIYFVDQAYSSSNELLTKNSNQFQKFPELYAKALLLSVDNYLALDDQFQASFTLQNIIQKFSDYTDVVNKAKQKQQSLEK